MGGKIIALSTPLWHTVLALFVGVALLFCLAVTTPKDTKITDDQNGKPTSRADQNMRGNETIEKSNSHNKRGTGSIGDLFSEKELQKIRWQISWLNNWCGAYKSKNRGMCRQPRNWKGNCLNGRCKFHSGKNVHGPISKEGRRNVMMAKIMNGSRSKKDISLLNPTEMKLFDDLQEMIKREYEVYDPIAISQIARLLIFQSFLMDKLEQGFNVSIESSSQEIRKWLAEYGLTPKSKATTLNIDPSGYQPWSWAKMVEEYYEKYEKNKEKEVEENGE